MNITFHVVSSFSITATCYNLFNKQQLIGKVFVLVFVFLSNILVHGLLDYAKHSYPFKSKLDVVLALFLFFIWIILIKREYYILAFVSFIGSIFPDIIDLGPSILNKHFHLSLPMIEIFPWHWKKYSGSVYDGSSLYLSLFNHSMVLVISFYLIFRTRKQKLFSKKY